MLLDFKIYFILFFIYSFLGWIVEVINEIVTTKKFVNRGFLIGPYCPIYGFGGLFITIFLQRYKDDFIVLFILSIAICSSIEYFTSYVLEKIFDARWWDYTDRKYNLNGRICLETLLPFGLLGLSMIYLINPIILKVLNKFDYKVINLLFIILISIFLIDLFVSSVILNKVKKDIKKVDKDNTEEITKKIKQVLSSNFLTRRLILAFPNVKYLKNAIKSNINKVITKDQKQQEMIMLDAETKIKKIKIDYDYKVSKIRNEANKKIERIKNKNNKKS